MRASNALALGPERRTMPMPPAPGGVAMAAMVDMDSFAPWSILEHLNVGMLYYETVSARYLPVASPVSVLTSFTARTAGLNGGVSVSSALKFYKFQSWHTVRR